jgi:hypothetical protein
MAKRKRPSKAAMSRGGKKSARKNPRHKSGPKKGQFKKRR